MPTLRQRLLRISPQQLRAFEATARLSSVTAAARELHVSQPTVSVQLREIAQALGEPLFETTGRRFRLTQAGELLRDTVEEIQQSWVRLESGLADIHGLVRGRLRIAAVTTAEYFVPDLLGPFTRQHPGVDIELAIENRTRIVERLQNGLDDVAVMMMPPQGLPLQAVPFLDNPLIVIGAKDTSFAKRKFPIERLNDVRWLMRELGSGTRMATEQHFESVKFSPKVVMSLGSNEAIKHAVAAGLGYAVVSELVVAEELKKGPKAGLQVVPVSGFPIKRTWSVVWRTDQPRSVAARKFIDYLGSGLQSTLKT